jgi:hypothetical protein
MSSTSPNTTRKKILALRADRLQKEVELLKAQEELATLSEDSLIIDPPSSSLSSSSTSLSSFASIPILTDSEILSDKLVASKITKATAEGKMKFYESDFFQSLSKLRP